VDQLIDIGGFKVHAAIGHRQQNDLPALQGFGEPQFDEGLTPVSARPLFISWIPLASAIPSASMASGGSFCFSK